MSSIKFQGHAGQKSRQFWPKLSVSGLWLKFDCINGFEMMHNAWHSIEELPYFLGHTSNFKVTRAEKSTIWIPIWDYKASRSYQIPQICLVFEQEIGQFIR